jgi:hypothetical protein
LVGRQNQLNEGLLSSDESNSLSYQDLLYELILSYDNRRPFNPKKRLEEFFSWVERIVVSMNRKKIFINFLDNKVTTIPVLAGDLQIPYQSAYRDVLYLVKIGILDRIIKDKYIKRVPGRAPAFYGLKNKWKPDDVIRAYEQYRKSKDGSYTLVRNLSQSILNDFIEEDEPEIKIQEIIEICKRNCRGFYSFDIAEQVANNLQFSHGVRVWR